MQRIKTIARAAERFARGVLKPRAQMEAAFTPFYAENRWGAAESVSGPGSTLSRTSKLRDELPGLLKEIGARTLVDAPCGDFNWMKDAPPPIKQIEEKYPDEAEGFFGKTLGLWRLRDL